MKEEYLSEIIETLENNSSEDDAYFDLDYENFNEKGEELPACIRSNKDGLILFAIELVKSVNKINKSKDEIQIIEINDKNWLGYDIKEMVSVIKPIYKIRKDINVSKPDKVSLKDHLIGFMMIFILLLLIVLAVIGIMQIISWAIN